MKYDFIEYDLNILYSELKSQVETVDSKYHFFIFDWLKMYIIGFLLKINIYQRLIFGNMIFGWLEKFQIFWSKYLHGRPIDIYDFHYLRTLYRSRFQNVKHTDENDKNKFLNAWQDPINLYFLLSEVWSMAKRADLNFYSFLRYIPKKGRILEYGCGLAPLTQGLLRYQSHRKLEYHIADIMQINFMYALYSVGQYKNVKHILLDPFENQLKKDQYDAVTCLAVFEHLPNPLSVIQNLYESLKKGGVLIFDYIKGSGEGLDTRKAVEDRIQVLDYMEHNFKVISGNLNKDNSMGLTVIKK